MGIRGRARDPLVATTDPTGGHVQKQQQGDQNTPPPTPSKRIKAIHINNLKEMHTPCSKIV
jgi:hypothetical protein